MSRTQRPETPRAKAKRELESVDSELREARRQLELAQKAEADPTLGEYAPGWSDRVKVEIARLEPEYERLWGVYMRTP